MRKSFPFVAVAVVLATLSSGCSMTAIADEADGTAPRPASSVPVPEPVPTTTTISVLAVGDSLASGGPWDALPQDPGSWTYHLGPELDVVGGWRRDGATSAQIASSIPQEAADALIVMAGTNDVRRALPIPELVANVDLIVSRTDVDQVVLAAIPPSTGFATEVLAANAALESLADARGWTWVDAWMLYRNDDGWAPNGSKDGVHGTDASYRSAGSAITAAVLEASAHGHKAE